MAIDDRTVAAVMLIERYAVMRSVQELRKRRLAVLDRPPPHVAAVELEKVERAEDHIGTVPAPAQQVEHPPARWRHSLATAAAARGKRSAKA